MRCRINSRENMRHEVDCFISVKVDSCASTHHSFCIDSQRPKRDNNEHIAVERAVLFGTVT